MLRYCCTVLRTIAITLSWQVFKDEEQTQVDPLLTRRLVSVVGHLAVCQLNHLDVAILGELKRRKALRDQKKEVKNAMASSASKGRRRKSSMGVRR